MPALVVEYGNLANTLMSEVGVGSAFDQATLAAPPVLRPYRCLWDTGATSSAITQQVVNDLQLKPIGIAKVNHADGSSMAEVFLASIMLPNTVGFNAVRVTCGKMTGFDVLIAPWVGCR